MINNLERQGFDKKSSTMRRILQKYDKNPAEFQRAVARDIETEYSEYVGITWICATLIFVIYTQFYNEK